MQESTEESRQRKTKCIDSQERMVKELFSAIVDTKMLNNKMTELYAKVDSNDRKHTEAINDLRNSVTAQNQAVLGSVESLKASMGAFIQQVGPYVEKAEGAKSFINKWSPYATVILVLYTAFGEKTEKLVSFLIKVAS